MQDNTNDRKDVRIEEDNKNTLVIPVIHEHVTFDKEVVETGKVIISKKVVEEEATLNIPLIQEGFTVESVPVKREVYDTPPQIRHEGDNMIIPVVKEVAVILKKYEVVEELHVIKKRTEVPQIEQITLLKEEVEVTRQKLNNT
jgi:uncharacterized protein (TIGR02271 family)